MVKKNRLRVSFGQVLQHIYHFHPGTPATHAIRIADRVCAKGWEDATLGAMVGICMSTYVRHTLTDYEFLMRQGVHRNDARARVAARHQEVIDAWAWGPPPQVKLTSMSFEV